VDIQFGEDRRGNRGKQILRLCLTVVLAAFVSACDRDSGQAAGPVYQEQAQGAKPVYRLAIHPLHNPRKLVEAYRPLVEYLNRHIDTVQFRVEASRDYQAYEVKFRNRGPELILPNPWQTLEAMKVGYRVIAMAGDAEDFKGIFIVRKDGAIETPADLKGKKVSYPSHTALAACIMPQRYLHNNGIDVRKDIENLYVGSQESSIMNVFLGETVAGATWPPPWRLFQKDRPEEAAELKVIWETPSLMNNSVMVRDDVPLGIGARVGELIYGLHEKEEGVEILGAMETARFYPADNDGYAPVRDFVAAFEQDVRLVEEP